MAHPGQHVFQPGSSNTPPQPAPAVNPPIGQLSPSAAAAQTIAHAPLAPGVTQVRSFHCRLAGESLQFLDDSINNFLREHPDRTPRFVTANVGEWSHKTGKEQNLIVQVWL